MPITCDGASGACRFGHLFAALAGCAKASTTLQGTCRLGKRVGAFDARVHRDAGVEPFRLCGFHEIRLEMAIVVSPKICSPLRGGVLAQATDSQPRKKVRETWLCAWRSLWPAPGQWPRPGKGQSDISTELGAIRVPFIRPVWLEIDST